MLNTVFHVCFNFVTLQLEVSFIGQVDLFCIKTTNSGGSTNYGWKIAESNRNWLAFQRSNFCLRWEQEPRFLTDGCLDRHYRPLGRLWSIYFMRLRSGNILVRFHVYKRQKMPCSLFEWSIVCQWMSISTKAKEVIISRLNSSLRSLGSWNSRHWQNLVFDLAACFCSR